MTLLMILEVVEAALLPCRSELQGSIDFKHCLLYRIGYFNDADAHAAH